eukprot:maker-scaffold_6-snap-gene-3.49-mRNA-1 protein AED:0.39 eAED:0.39 QI:76/1/1/1/1/1/3/183/164
MYLWRGRLVEVLRQPAATFGYNSTRKTDNTQKETLQYKDLDDFEYLYLSFKGFIQPLKLNDATVIQSKEDFLKFAVFCYFCQKEWIVKEGFNYGGDFVLYRENPDRCHSTYVVKVVDKNNTVPFMDIYRQSRIANTARKVLLCSNSSMLELADLFCSNKRTVEV